MTRRLSLLVRTDTRKEGQLASVFSSYSKGAFHYAKIFVSFGQIINGSYPSLIRKSLLYISGIYTFNYHCVILFRLCSVCRDGCKRVAVQN